MPGDRGDVHDGALTPAQRGREAAAQGERREEIQLEDLAPEIEAAIEAAEAPGCAPCRQSGYAGRLAIGEGFLVDDSLREAIGDATGARLAAALKVQGFTTIAQAAAAEAASGRIAPAEIRALALA